MVDITDKKLIAKMYLQTWFTVDFLAVVPFDDIFNSMYLNLGDSNMLIRMTKIPKIYKIIRLLRLVKLVKVLKHKDTLSQHFSKKSENNAGFERLVMGTVLYAFFCHLFACTWMLIGQL
jgi:potassium voltage-gated channel Eag-related subfamily H protein 6/hyperpolarization activated cyclic nucleotide-gated potassium channel 2